MASGTSRRNRGRLRGAQRPDSGKRPPSAAGPSREAGPRGGRRAKAGEPAAGTAPLAVRCNYDPDHRVVAITGARSFLGEQLVGRLEEDRRYVKVLAIDLSRPQSAGPKTHFHKVDLTLPTAAAEVAQVLKREGADTMVHLAFLSKPTHNSAWAHELEAIGSLHVLNACAACKVHKVVQWSLTGLYGPSPQNPNYLGESRRTEGVPGSRFFADKLEAERLARRYRSENPQAVVTILRTAAILGRRCNNYVSQYFSLPLAPVLLGYDPLIQLLHEEDAVCALKLAVDNDHDGEFNVASNGVLPLSTALAMCGRLTVPFPPLLAFPLAKVLWMTQVLDFAPAFLDFLRYLCVADIEKARQVMGWTPAHDIQQVLAEFAGTAVPARAASHAPPSSLSWEGGANVL